MKAHSRHGYRVLKRTLDIFFSSVLLFFLALPMILILLIVRIDTRGSGIFRQIRVGRDERLFVCYKFRTMYVSAPPCLPSSEFFDSEKYITPFGRFLRRTSLDELPQLVNVLKGDMSIVGPRPLVLAEHGVHRRRRENGVYSLRPGITGLSQVCGRNRISDAEKVKLDTKYLYEFGLMQDVKIIGLTLGKVISGDGVKSGGEEKE